ncbi:hypothetical protein EDEG_01316 [Edhazardia aedis USNM 41457]|uniref:Uncharacterized protein n=1 Tax=Edhazardia aedis (strain USNM 41457) TaxID=1003232 RepID=J9D9K0_EDHAE|nr:hypothetical protein EDEG_01316 [Edhazardia aedis USNM 41457]|eukprot:EJW04446.1 hypothetical protein EDEG_01316 [Edhazardia aedis USNM 41457]
MLFYNNFSKILKIFITISKCSSVGYERRMIESKISNLQARIDDINYQMNSPDLSFNKFGSIERDLQKYYAELRNCDNGKGNGNTNIMAKILDLETTRDDMHATLKRLRSQAARLEACIQEENAKLNKLREE